LVADISDFSFPGASSPLCRTASSPSGPCFAHLLLRFSFPPGDVRFFRSGDKSGFFRSLLFFARGLAAVTICGVRLFEAFFASPSAPAFCLRSLGWANPRLRIVFFSFLRWAKICSSASTGSYLIRWILFEYLFFLALLNPAAQRVRFFLLNLKQLRLDVALVFFVLTDPCIPVSGPFHFFPFSRNVQGVEFQGVCPS